MVWLGLQQYSFDVPAGEFKEEPTNVFDPEGSEIDLKLRGNKSGSISVVVAPIKRFREVPEGQMLAIEDVGDEKKVLSGFHSELFNGEPLDDNEIESMWRFKDTSGLTYYRYNLDPRRLVTATAMGNKMLILAIGASALQWRKSRDSLLATADSFRVYPPTKA